MSERAGSSSLTVAASTTAKPDEPREAPWKRPFDDPIILPDDHMLVTLLDAATYATELPKKVGLTASSGRPAIEALILVANSRIGPTMLARIGVVRALSAGTKR